MPHRRRQVLCYQVPALVRPAPGVIISPLIALMHDQVQALRQLGVRAAALNSSLQPARPQVERAFAMASWTCCMWRPERLFTDSFQTLLRGRASLCSPSMRRTAFRNGDMISAPNIGSSPCCTTLSLGAAHRLDRHR